jgi:hypothetical protein
MSSHFVVLTFAHSPYTRKGQFSIEARCEAGYLRNVFRFFRIGISVIDRLHRCDARKFVTYGLWQFVAQTVTV